MSHHVLIFIFGLIVGMSPHGVLSGSSAFKEMIKALRTVNKTQKCGWHSSELKCLFLQERQKQLESLGISLQSSGIRVIDDKCFLVNLNADPALNELLLYYLKVQTQMNKDQCYFSAWIFHINLFICMHKWLIDCQL